MPVPEPLVGGLVAGIVLHVVVRWNLLSRPGIGHAIGWPLVLVGGMLAVWAVAAAGLLDLEEPARVVVAGPYAHTRNPMYVAWTLVYVGVSFLVNTVWPLVLLPAAGALIHVSVLHEERDLDRRFGAVYRQYRTRTRRYL